VILLDARDYWAKMRKSLGDKRKYITDQQITELTTLYGQASTAAADPDHPLHGKVKIFATTDFGYQRITVERPLRLRFEVTKDALAGLEIAKPLLKYDGRDKLLDALQSLVGHPAALSRTAFRGALAAALAPLGKLPVPVDKAVWAAVSVSDPVGELQTDRAGNPLPDPDLRDNETVPLHEDVDDYVAREVLPHVPDAWVDHSKTKIGYEIPFTRYFFVYVPPRPLGEIDAELSRLEA
jgi:type I restriction enzyme M protein